MQYEDYIKIYLKQNSGPNFKRAYATAAACVILKCLLCQYKKKKLKYNNSLFNNYN